MGSADEKVVAVIMVGGPTKGMFAMGGDPVFDFRARLVRLGITMKDQIESPCVRSVMEDVVA